MATKVCKSGDYSSELLRFFSVPANTIADAGHRIAPCPQIYVRSGTSAFGIANTIENGGHRIAPCPQIYVRSEASVFGFANPIAEVAHRIAPCPQIYVGLESPIKIVTRRACRAPGRPPWRLRSSFNRKSYDLINETEDFLFNPGPEASGPQGCRNLPCTLAPRSGCPKTARGSLL